MFDKKNVWKPKTQPCALQESKEHRLGAICFKCFLDDNFIFTTSAMVEKFKEVSGSNSMAFYITGIFFLQFNMTSVV